MLAQVGTSLVGEQGVHQDVFFVHRQVADLLGDLVKGGGDQRSRRHVGRQDLGVADGLGSHVGIDAARGLAVVAADVVLHFLGDQAPALAGEHVHDRLGAHDLGHGGDQRRISHFGAHPGNLLHDLRQAVFGVLNLQLGDQVGHHTAGNLMGEHLHVGQGRNAALVVGALAHLFPVLGDLEQKVQIIAGIVTAFLKGGHDGFHRGMAVAKGQGRMGGVRDGSAGFRSLDYVHGSHAAHVVAVYVHRQADLGVQGLDQALGPIRSQHARHVLDGDGVGAQLLELLGVLQVAVQGVDGRDGVGDGTLEVGAHGLDGLGVVHYVADVVQRVEHAEHVDAVAMGSGDEAVHDFLGVVLVAYQVLAAGKHGKRGVGSQRLDGAQALPRVLIQEAQAGVEGRTAPCLDCPVAHTIHLRQNRLNIADGHAGCPQALLAVTNGGIHQLKP